MLMFDLILVFFIGISLHHSAFHKQFALFAIKLNQLILNGNNSIQRRIDIKTSFVKMINFHITTKSLVLESHFNFLEAVNYIEFGFFYSIFTKSANFYSVIIFLELISATIRLSIAVFQIETVSRSNTNSFL